MESPSPSGATPEVDLQLDGRAVLEFQPAVDLSSGRLLGFEALLRWEHPTRGRIAPAVFTAWAEAHDQLAALDTWVLAESCRQAAAWPSGLQVAVNCSLVLLHRQQAAEAAADALAGAGLPPDRLTVEITETAVTDERAAADLRELSRLGARLAVDDVGTTWSTLENMRRFAIETAKIDRHFIAALDSRDGMSLAIVEAIVHVSNSLAMTTVAEGVETADQVAALRVLGADVAQGHFFAAPMPAEEALRLASAEPHTVFSLTAGESEADPAAPARPLLLLPGQGAGPDDRTAPHAGRERPRAAAAEGA